MFDEDILNPKRLLIMTALFIFKHMTEAELVKATGITWGSLSTQLSRLEKKRYLTRKKAITNKGVRTIVEITEEGYNKYKEEIEKLKKFLENLGEVPF